MLKKWMDRVAPWARTEDSAIQKFVAYIVLVGYLDFYIVHLLVTRVGGAWCGRWPQRHID